MHTLLLLLLLITFSIPHPTSSTTTVWTNSPTGSPTRPSQPGANSCGVPTSNVDLIDVPPETFKAYDLGPIARTCQASGFDGAGYDTSRRTSEGYVDLACFRTGTVRYIDHVWVGTPTRMQVHDYARLVKGCTGILTGIFVQLAGSPIRYSYEVAIVPMSTQCKIMTTTQSALDNTLTNWAQPSDIKNNDLAAHLTGLVHGYQSGYNLDSSNPASLLIVLLGSCSTSPPSAQGVTAAPTGVGPADCTSTCSILKTQRVCQRFRPNCRCTWTPSTTRRRSRVGVCAATGQ